MELFETINSMFKWYMQTAVCFLSQSDVVAIAFKRNLSVGR